MSWNPELYHKFERQRFEPFEDLFAMIRVRDGMKVIDLGCGTGLLTSELADRLQNSEIVGIDNSESMLEKANSLCRDNVRFDLTQIEEVEGNWDLIFSNAALHWVADHKELIPRLLRLLNPRGQIAVQLPSNHRNPAHHIINELAAEEPFVSSLGSWSQKFHMLSIDEYADLLYANGANDITIFDKGYCHELESVQDMLDWISGTTLRPYFSRLSNDLIDEFMIRLKTKLSHHWQKSPILFLFRRILFSATVT